MQYFYVTTPIFFANAPPHIGHLYTCLIGDFFSRFQKQIGNEVIFITGTDEHGSKITSAAELHHKSPQQYVDKIASVFEKTWREFNIDFTTFIRTTKHIHTQEVKRVLTELNTKQLIEYKNYSSFYCVHCEEYFTKYQATATFQKCTNCKRQILMTKAKNYFFKVTHFHTWITDLLQDQLSLVEPKFYVREICNNFLSQDFCNLLIARKNTGWGIPFSIDARFEIYVWVDALCAYFSALLQIDVQRDLYQKVWKSTQYQIVHLMSKEIIRFHCVYFLILLNALELKHENVAIKIHGWLLTNNDKISKSKHQMTLLTELAKKFTTDSIRFYLLYNHNIFHDFTFSTTQIKEVNNSILVNKIGNLFQRLFCLYQQKKMKAQLNLEKLLVNHPIQLKITEQYRKYTKIITSWQLDMAMEMTVRLANQINKEIDNAKPWLIIDKTILERVFAELLGYLKLLIWMMAPMFVKTVKKIMEYFIFDFLEPTTLSIIHINVSKKWEPLFQKL